MIDEAAVFVMADPAAVQVFSAIADDQWDSMLPPVFDMPGADQPLPLRRAVNAVHIGVGDGMSEELARALLTGTEPAADMWRSFGVFRSPIPIAGRASGWTQFLAISGRLDG